MNQKGFASVVIIALVILLAAALGYIFFMKKPAPAEKTQPIFEQNLKQDTSASSNNSSSENPQMSQPSNSKTKELPSSCVDESEGMPVITSISKKSGPVETKLEIGGCNFSGFEGDKNAWIENAKGEKGFLPGETGSTGKLLKVTLKSPLCQKDTSYSGLPCDELLTLSSGVYKIYAFPWGKKSNEVEFKIE